MELNQRRLCRYMKSLQSSRRDLVRLSEPISNNKIFMKEVKIMRSVEFSQRTVENIAEMNRLVAICNAKRAAGEPYAEKDGALDKAKAAAKTVNKSIVEDAIRELLDMGKADKVSMFKSYMADWAVQGYTVKETDLGIIADPKAEIRIDFSSMDAASPAKLSQRGDWMKLASVFIDNILINWASKDNGGGVDLLSLPADMLQFRATLGENWMTKDGKPRTGKDMLVSQFTEVVAAIFPAELACKMTRADVRNFGDAVKGYKRTKTNAAMTFKVSGGKSAEEILFDCIYARMNNLAVKIEDDYKRDGNAGKPGAGEKPAVAGPVVTVEESAKPAAKENPAA